MKRFIALVALFVLVICLLSCSYEGTYDDGYEDGYDYGIDAGWYDGYDDGYDEGHFEGYYEGIERAQKSIEVRVEDDLSSLDWDIYYEYGMFPEDALFILTNFIDFPESISEEELYTAIYAIRSYYFASQQIPSGIDDYWID